MAASIVCWPVPKLIADVWRHCTDFIQVWRKLDEETCIVREGSHAFDAVMELMNACEVGKTIHPVCVAQVSKYVTYDLTAGCWTVFFELPTKPGQPYLATDFARVDIVPTRYPPLCNTRTYVCVQVNGPDAEWKENPSGQYEKQPGGRSWSQATAAH